MEKLYDRIDWHNDREPALNETNLNLMSKALDDIDDRVVDLAADIMEVVAETHQDVIDAQAAVADAHQEVIDAQAAAANANTYQQQAKEYRDEAEQIVGIGIATTTKAGIVKPDGNTIFVANDGKITAGISDNDFDQIKRIFGIT